MNQSIDSQALDLMLRAGSRWVLWLLIGLSIGAVARACIEHMADGPEAIEEHIAAVIETDRLQYERGLAFLGTLGSNAPFVGLFGTVLGIVRAFHDLATSAAMGSQAVMAGIAEALVATAIGLLVALPAVASYNALMRHVETAMAAANAVGHQILAYARARRPDGGASANREAR
jgi:biopolymer transport protein ExbB